MEALESASPASCKTPATLNDQRVKNQWKWEWLQVNVGESDLSDCICEIDRSRYALGVYCNCQISYGTNGKTALKRHVSNSNKKHRGNKKVYITNMVIPNSWHDPTVQAQKNPRDVNCVKLIVLYHTGLLLILIVFLHVKSLMEPKKQ